MIGRALGIGVRVVGRMAGQHLSAPAQPAAAAPQVLQTAPFTGSQAQSTRDQKRAAGQAAAQATIQAGQSVGQARKSVSRGVGGFLRPFRRVGGILWLEVSGVFFLIFVPVFAWRGIWPARASYLHGPDHLRFLVFTGLALMFLYLGVSSFWRAHRRSKQS
jgi:hypothetical protein